MSVSEYGESLLLVKFRQFYSEVIFLKRLVSSSVWEGSQPEEANSPAKAPKDVGKHLLLVLEQQAIEVQQQSSEYAILFKDAQYIMAALADEIFLHLEWEGREAWKNNLLESRLFQSHGAGELFFQRLEELLRTRDPGQVEIAKIYLLALALGFEGKWRGIDHKEPMDSYRRQLFAFIFQRNPDALRQYLYENEAKRLFPEAYAYTLDQNNAKRIPDLRQWMMIFILMILGFIVVSHGLWLQLTSELNQILLNILT